MKHVSKRVVMCENIEVINWLEELGQYLLTNNYPEKISVPLEDKDRHSFNFSVTYQRHGFPEHTTFCWFNYKIGNEVINYWDWPNCHNSSEEYCRP